jgi:carbonic anhydrase
LKTEVIVLRNIGGRTEPALENILVLDSFVKVSDIIVVHHTGKVAPSEQIIGFKALISCADCGATHVTEAQVRSDLKKRLPDNEEIEQMKFGEIRE